jgi:acetyl esterase/lipase
MRIKTAVAFLIVGLACFTLLNSCSATNKTNSLNKSGTIDYDIVYKTVGDVSLTMDIHYPERISGVAPAVIYVHGGAWTAGDKSSGAGVQFIPELVSRGYVVVSINYRLAPHAKVIDQIGDVKCAVRYLRAKASDYGIDANHVGVIGGSAGGHLVALLGASDGSSGLEGDGCYPEQSSRVQAVVDLFGPADLVTMFESTSPSWLQNVFGALEHDSDDIKKVSPITHVTGDDPPFLILHGDNDSVVPFEQSEILLEKLQYANVPATLIMVEDAGHGFRPVPAGSAISPSQSELTEIIADFFDLCLKNNASGIFRYYLLYADTCLRQKAYLGSHAPTGSLTSI